MTQEDQAAVIGRLVLERRDLQTKLTALEAEAQRLGEIFAAMGSLLQQRPEQIVFENHPAPAGAGTGTPLFKLTDISSERLIKLVDDLRETKRALESMNARVARLGI